MFGLFQRFRRRLDGMITRVENHEALVASAARELEATAARAERERERLLASSARLAASAAEERESAARWRERALREAAEARGVECLRRSKWSARRARELDERLLESRALEVRYAARAELLRSKLAEFREQESLLRERKARAEIAAAPGAHPEPSLELAELLARWEAHLAQAEHAHGALPFSLEMFDEEPLDAAEEAALVRELRELKETAR